LQSFGAPLNAQTQQAAEKVLLPFWTNIAQPLIGAESTVEDKNVIIDKIKSTLFGAETLPLRELKLSSIKGVAGEALRT
jgi:hypothetical protein